MNTINKSDLKPEVQEAVAVIERLRAKAAQRVGAALNSTEIIRAFRDNIGDEPLNDDNLPPR